MSVSVQNMVKTLIDAVKKTESKTSAYDTPATVRRIEGDTAWVHINGGVDETPVKLTIAANVGDDVQVRVSGGRAFLVGNGTAPPTDDKTAIHARTLASSAQNTAADAQETAEMAQSTASGAATIANTAITIAEGTNEHFWNDNTGAHVTQVTQDEWNDSSSPNYHSGGNTLITSEGMAIRDGMTELAVFGASGAQIGQSSAAHSVIDSSGQRFYANDGSTQLANIGYGIGTSSTGTATAPYYTFGRRSGTIGNYSVAEGTSIGINNISYTLVASGYASHAEGLGTTASNEGSHAEGEGSTASGDMSHAEGYLTTASGTASHAEGYETTASGNMSHANGRATEAAGLCQTAIGRYNVIDGSGGAYYGTNAFIIGNGTSSSARSNALTVDWSGNVDAAGDITDGSSNTLSSVATKVNTYVSNIKVIRQTGTITISAGSTSSPSSTNLSVSSSVGNGTLVGAELLLGQQALPYGTSGTMQTWLWHVENTNKRLVIKNATSAWTNYSYTAILFVIPE